MSESGGFLDQGPAEGGESKPVQRGFGVFPDVTLAQARQRAAIEVIQEERTAHRDPEDRDGDLPQLEGPPANSN